MHGEIQIKNKFIEKIFTENIHRSVFSFLFLWTLFPLVGIKWEVALCLCMACSLFQKKIAGIMSIGIFVIYSFIGEYRDIISRFYLIIPMVISLVVVWYPFRKTTNRRYSVYLILSWISLFITDVVMQPSFVSVKYFFQSNRIRSLTILLIISCIVVFQVFIKKIKIAFYVIYNLLFLLGCINYWVYAITYQPFKPSDVLLAKTAFGVLSGVDISFKYIGIFFLCLICVAGFNVCIHRLKIEQSTSVNKEGLLAAVIFGIIFLMFSNNTIGMLQYRGNIKYGFVGNFLLNIKMLDKTPSGYEDILDYELFPDEGHTNVANNVKPNILVVMNESFCDLSEVGDFKTNKDYIPYTKSLIKKYPSGIVYSSVKGNNTVSSEFSFLTGIPTALVGSGAEIYQGRIHDNMRSIASVLGSVGYYTVGIHPYDENGYNRSAAWGSMGFDMCYYQGDFTGAQTLRSYITDSEAYKKLVEECSRCDEPFFGFLTTMQNHATYAAGIECDIYTEDYDYADVNEYLTLSNISDLALKELVSEIEKMEEPTYLLYFGDHQPMLDVGFYEDVMGVRSGDFSLEQQSLMYRVPYILYSNVDVIGNVPEETSMNYLASILLNAAGIDNDWFSYTFGLINRYPVITDRFIKMNGDIIGYPDVEKSISALNMVSADNEFYELKKYQVFSYYSLQN